MKFRIITEPEEYDECHALLMAEKWPPVELGHPTVTARDEQDELIGFVSTDLQDDLVVAGPLVLRQEKLHAFTALSLLLAYEEMIGTLGVKRYIFYVDPTKTPGLVRGIKKYFPDLKPYATQGTKEFYVRALDEDRKNVFRAGVH